mmetsp:Transcript_22227/g.63182  ORF Transcript_22227/g.63182 Transcript_22227/m.63182 type:complete len:318 (+) Transcript_22227:890-1843(+)
MSSRILHRQDLKLDQDIFLWTDPFSLGSVMIGTHLAVHQRKDIIPLSEQNLVLGSKRLELPSDEGVIVRIDRGRNKCPPPIDPDPEILQMGDSNRRKIHQPVVRIDKLRNFIQRHHFGKNIPLTNDPGTCLLDQLGLASLGLVRVLSRLCLLGGRDFSFHLCADFGVFLGELRRASVHFNLAFQLVCSRLDGHSSTMESKRKQDILSLVTFELRSEDRLGQGKGVSNVQVSVRIGVRKGHHEGFRVGIWIGLKGAHFFPLFLNRNFIGAQRIAFGGSLGHGSLDGQILHLVGRWCGGHDDCIVVVCIAIMAGLLGIY